MDVLVKGMKMPSCCMFCPISNASGCGMMNPPVLMTSKEMLADRPDWCPLVPVTPHGRLIDASEEIQVQMYDDQHEDFYQVKMTIDDLLSQSWIDAKAPTVIPAEEGET